VALAPVGAADLTFSLEKQGYLTERVRRGITFRVQRGTRIRALCGLVFYPLLWLRGLVVVLSRVVSVLGMVAAVAVGTGSLLSHQKLRLLAGICAASSFLAFLLLELYDTVLLRLNPTGRTMIFFR
jgi:hypothetical protein